MNYEFPKIVHINDVLPAIAGRDEFIVVQKDGYQVVNYAVMMEDSFPPVNPKIDENVIPFYVSLQNMASAVIRRECRGLVFDLDGNIINRRYHKFFNVNERDETRFENVDLTKPHVILDKLDGSMVSPCYVKGHIRWMTKMGITDTSMEAETFVATHRDYVNFAEFALSVNKTPVFEWCSNKNRIVLAYPEDNLVLTAIRDNVTGLYESYENLRRLVTAWNIPLVKAYDYKSADILDIVRAMEDAEGVVIRFDDGHMLKVKADWYVLRHKSKDAITREKNVLDYVVNERVDDVLPFLQVEDQTRLLRFQDKFWDGIKETVKQYEAYVDSIRAVDRRTWAIEYMPEQKSRDSHLAPIVFGWYSGRSVRDCLIEIVRKNIGSQVRINENRDLWGGISWSYNFDGDV